MIRFDLIMVYLIIESIQFDNEIDLIIEPSIMVKKFKKWSKIFIFDRIIIENIQKILNNDVSLLSKIFNFLSKFGRIPHFFIENNSIPKQSSLSKLLIMIIIGIFQIFLNIPNFDSITHILKLIRVGRPDRTEMRAAFRKP